AVVPRLSRLHDATQTGVRQLQRAARGAVAGLPVLRDAGRVDGPGSARRRGAASAAASFHVEVDSAAHGGRTDVDPRQARGRSARRIPPRPSPDRCAATSRRRCLTTSCTAPTRPSRPRARSRSGSATALSEPDYLAVNREAWTRANRDHTDARAHGAWSKAEMDWGVWAVPESDVGVLPDVEGMDVVELGCGTAYFGAWLAKRGARVVGVDITPAQLDTARRLEAEFALGMQFIEANAEETGLPDAS